MDDRLLPVTRWMGYLIVPILGSAFVILFLLPTRTAQLWAWPLEPPVTATALGGSYLAGAYYFVRVSRARRWHTIGWGLPAITVFTSALLGATVLHWDRFTHAHVSFWAWLVLYVATPPLLPWVWQRNRRHDPGVGLGPMVAVPIRAVAAGAGALLLIAAAVVYAVPSVAVDRWPWPLTPLTARTLAAFATVPAITLLTFAWEARWSALAILVETSAIGLGLTAVGVLTRLGDLRAGRAGVVVYLAVLLGVMAALVALMVTHRTSRTRPVAAAPSP